MNKMRLVFCGCLPNSSHQLVFNILMCGLTLPHFILYAVVVIETYVDYYFLLLI